MEKFSIPDSTNNIVVSKVVLVYDIDRIIEFEK